MMKITNLRELNASKKLLADRLSKLHEDNQDLLVYAPSVADQRAPRHLYVVNDPARLFQIQGDIKEAQEVKDAITEFYGDDKRRNNLSMPTVLRDVAMVRIWLNNAISSRKISKETIINRLSKYLEISKRLAGEDLAESKARLTKELEYFRTSKELEYVLRGAAAQDVTMRIYFENNEEQRMRLTSAGLFITGKEYTCPRILTPTSETTNQREGIYENIKPVPYSGAPAALLYKKSDIEREKVRADFDQDLIKRNKKAQERGARKK